jgi:signal transduction histidine kinase
MTASRRTSPRLLAWGAWASQHRYHLIFGISLFMLALLVAWWGMFLWRSVEKSHMDRYSLLELRMQIYSSLLGHVEDADSLSGVIPRGEGLNVVACTEAGTGLQIALSPFHQELCMVPEDAVVQELELDYRRRSAMVAGEAALSVFLIIVIAWMFYRLLEAERRSQQELQELWSRVTHELKTPIAGIKALLQTLQSQEFSRQELAPLLEMGLREADRQELLAENLLIGQRLSRGAYAMKPTRMILPEFVRNHFARTSLNIHPDRLRVEIACEPDTAVMADAGGLRMVLDNLLDNAVKYCGDGLVLSVSVERSGDRVTVTVADNGPGFPQSDAEQIFEAYRRLDGESSSSRRGTGMGLHISRRLMREMGGNLAASSEGLGKGARFVIAFWEAGSWRG